MDCLDLVPASFWAKLTAAKTRKPTVGDTILRRLVSIVENPKVENRKGKTGGGPRRRGANRSSCLILQGRKQRRAAVMFAGEDDHTLGAAIYRLRQVARRAIAGALAIGAWGARDADCECRQGVLSLPFDQLRSLPHTTHRRRAGGIRQADRERDVRDYPAVRRLQGLGGTSGCWDRLLFCVSGAIATTANAGAVQIHYGAAGNAKVCVAHTAHVDVDTERRSGARELVDVKRLRPGLTRQDHARSPDDQSGGGGDQAPPC